MHVTLNQGFYGIFTIRMQKTSRSQLAFFSTGSTNKGCTLYQLQKNGSKCNKCLHFSL
jgi:hypothetical protein